LADEVKLPIKRKDSLYQEFYFANEVDAYMAASLEREQALRKVYDETRESNTRLMIAWGEDKAALEAKLRETERAHMNAVGLLRVWNPGPEITVDGNMDAARAELQKEASNG
jgi:pyruvate/2-oxoacid:ferredoxin oxidoreductase alpha subunit